MFELFIPTVLLVAISFMICLGLKNAIEVCKLRKGISKKLLITMLSVYALGTSVLLYTANSIINITLETIEKMI